MLFNSLEFLIFLPIVLIIYYTLNLRAQNIFLLAASYFFYGFWDWRFLFLLMLSTVVDYFVGKIMYEESDAKKRKKLLAISAVVNLSLLGFFKYFNFFIDSASEMLTLFGLNASMPMLSIVLPVGISFYTFQTMTYTIDIYRKKLEPTHNFFEFALFVAYFPQLVAGPIERASKLLPQISSKRVVSEKFIHTGIMLIMIGVVKKVIIADNISIYVDFAFSNYDLQNSGVLLKGLYLFAIQIYCDFSGYSDIARGVSSLLGIKLMINFNQPYLSQSVTEFWRRWHISLSSWLRDYLYIPLGGNKGGSFSTYKNLFLTMLLGGLWHGANWTFVVWGALNGLYLSAEKLTIYRTKRFELPKPPNSLISYLITIAKMVFVFHLICLTWIFFRAPDFSSALGFLLRILEFNSISSIGLMPFIIMIVMLVIDLPQYVSGDHIIFLKLPIAVRIVGYALVIAGILILGITNETPFIYFQF